MGDSHSLHQRRTAMNDDGLFLIDWLGPMMARRPTLVVVVIVNNEHWEAITVNKRRSAVESS